jgi:hypothetical protein
MPTLFNRHLPRLVVIYADKEQIYRNCFISQLYKVLSESFVLYPISQKELLSGRAFRPQSAFGVLSLLKQRSWGQALQHLRSFLNGSPIVFYDQDPWEAYHDHASSPGIYVKVNSDLNVARFLVTSNFWANHIASCDSLPVQFVRMGILPSWCESGPAFEDRSIRVGFQGTIHQHRKAFFGRMERIGVPVTVRPPAPYRNYLKEIQNFQIVLHNEASSIAMDGIPCDINGLWVKEVEVAARGCFAVRNTDKDIDAYDIAGLPTVFTFNDELEVPAIINEIFALSPRQHRQMVEESIAAIRQRNDWMTVVAALHAAF